MNKEDMYNGISGICPEYLEEADSYKPVKTFRVKKNIPGAAAVLVAVLLLGSATTAFAMDLGGVRRAVQLWIHGEQTEVTLTTGDGNYDIEYTDENGNPVHLSGGGVAVNSGGTDRKLTAEELWNEINAPDVVYGEDGSVWLYYLDQEVDITDKFTDDVCYLKIQAGEETVYITVKYKNGYAWSSHAYVQPRYFNN